MSANKWRVVSGRRARLRYGGGLIYFMFAFAVLVCFASLVVDYGAAQLAKIELQRTADATSHDYIALYNMNGKGYANSNGPNAHTATINTVDTVLGVSPNYQVTWGYWDAATRSFSVPNNGGDTAVRVTASLKKSNGNAVPLLFGSLMGRRSVDMTATSISTSSVATPVTMTISAQSDIYFSGMPTDTISTYGDDATLNPTTPVTAIPVTPGSVLTFVNTSGTSSVYPPGMPYVGAEGTITGPNGTATNHGVSWYGSGSPYSENGIADAVIPESSLVGLFLDDNQPDSSAAPATVDWTNASVKDQATYTNLQLKAPFYIGDGMTSGGSVQQFTVPAGATRFYIGLWDGLQFNNNDGSITVTIATTKKVVKLVK